MSLINTQLIAMRQTEVNELQARLRDEIEPALARDPTKKNKAAKATAEQRINILVREITKMQAENDTLEAERSRAATAKAAAAAVAEEGNLKRMLSKPHDVTLECLDCQSHFEFSVRAQRRFQENGWLAPVRCDTCRAERKANRLEPITLECCDCQGELLYTVRQQINAKENGWEPPKRCRDCKEKKSQAIAAARAEAKKPTLINCGDCRKDFSFTKGAQKFHEEKGWKDPKWCPDCRKKRRSDGASTHSTRTPVSA